MNLNTPKAVLTGLSLISLSILFQPIITQLLTPPVQAQALSPEHEILKADHQAMKTVLTNLAFTVEHLPACSKQLSAHCDRVKLRLRAELVRHALPPLEARHPISQKILEKF